MRTKILAFALSGFMAGYAGVCLAFADQRISVNTFDPAVSILVISMVVIGGLGSIDGAVLGALYLVGLPAIFGTTATIQFITSGIGLLAFILYLPGGLAELLRRFGDLVSFGWDRLVEGRWTGRAPAAVASLAADPDNPTSPTTSTRRWPWRAPGATVAGRCRASAAATSWRVVTARLAIDDVAVAFGGLHALDGVDPARSSPARSWGSSARTGRARPPCSTR